MNHRLALELAEQVKTVKELTWQFVGPDTKLGTPCHMFIALHMDGSNNEKASGPSVGYPPLSVESKRFGELWKQARLSIPGALPFRQDNYTKALSGYYGFGSSYSGVAPVKIVIENGFVTNDKEASWAQMHRATVASAIIGTIAKYYGLTTPTPIDNEKPTVPDLPAPPTIEERLAMLERKVARTTKEVDPRQAAHINGLQTRVRNTETSIEELRMELAALRLGTDADLADRVTLLEQFKAALQAL